MRAMVLGITGAIGAGKSVIAQALNVLYAIPIFDCDREAKQLYYSADVRGDMLKELCIDPIDSGGSIDKETITSILNDRLKKPILERIIHQAVADKFNVWQQQQSSPFVALESAILFTSELYKICDVIISVDACRAIRLQRVLRRDGQRGEIGFQQMEKLQEEEVKQQKLYADITIDNSGDSSIIRAIESSINQLDLKYN